MKATRLRTTAVLIVLTGCARAMPLPPTAERPDPAYFPVGADGGAAWDAIVDVLADFGVDFDYISPEMRFAKISGRLVSGPNIRVRDPGGFLRAARADTVPTPEAIEWADCGTVDGQQAAGWGNLFARFSIRVRDDHGEGIVKVVVSEMWQEMRRGVAVEPVVLPCVSRGTFEELVVHRIQERVIPRMGSRARAGRPGSSESSGR